MAVPGRHLGEIASVGCLAYVSCIQINDAIVFHLCDVTALWRLWRCSSPFCDHQVAMSIKSNHHQFVGLYRVILVITTVTLMAMPLFQVISSHLFNISLLKFHFVLYVYSCAE